jgi:molybdate transport system substrate-binding protein
MNRVRRRCVEWIAASFALLAIAGTGAALPTPARAEGTPVTVFAAASLKNALDEIAAAWQAETGKPTAISYAASSALAKQIEEGAPADIFFSADLAWMDYLAERTLILEDSRHSLLGNRIVLVAPADSTVEATIGANFPLAELLGDGYLAMADPEAVPAGKYGKAALEKLGVWDSVAGKVAAAENVRAALLLVSRGEAPLGIVYRTDVAAEPGVRIVDTFPADSHPPIVYPVAAVASSTNPDRAAFLDYLRSPAARAVFEKQGFTVLD